MSWDALVDAARREARNIMTKHFFAGTLVCTSYDPEKHVIKGIIVPHGIETDWIPIGTHHIGKDFGILVGPKPGDPKKLDGDQFDIEFDGGDLNTPIARLRVHSTDDKPPKVESGEILLKHKEAGSFFFDKDKNITWTGSDGQTIITDKDKNITVTTPNGDIKHTAKKGSIIHTAKNGHTIKARRIDLNPDG